MHPYKTIPSCCRWKESVAEVPAERVDPVVSAKFKIIRTDRIATGGSCFAQHIARHLKLAGFNYLVTETGHPIIPPNVAERHGYGLFTARYGNIYTSRQFLQLLKRAYALFAPFDDIWEQEDGFIDPFRPQIQLGGFSSRAEYLADRSRHLTCVRRAVEESDVFIFTLGLTETWISRADGAAYPLCPGVAGGIFDPNKHSFVNMGAGEVTADMVHAIKFMRSKNPRLRVILTVSPVPLIATAENRSVLVSNTYSKSVLRVACEEICAELDDVAYFPSYEIIAGNYNRGAYFAKDLRSVTEPGVAHVMRLFMHHYTEQHSEAPAELAACQAQSDPVSRQMEDLIAVICDEEALVRN